MGLLYLYIYEVITQSAFGVLVVSMLACGTFGVLVVSMLACGIRVRGFKPSQKFVNMPSFGREVKPFAPCSIYAACYRTL
jgi:hypothetical protein